LLYAYYQRIDSDVVHLLVSIVTLVAYILSQRDEKQKEKNGEVKMGVRQKWLLAIGCSSRLCARLIFISFCAERLDFEA
jgi:hypothetical protein